MTAAAGLQQLSRDDTEIPDALSSLEQDPPMSNQIAADGHYEVRSAQELAAAPCVLLCATDGFFNYVQTPAHFEYIVLEALSASADPAEWGELLARKVQDYTPTRTPASLWSRLAIKTSASCALPSARGPPTCAKSTGSHSSVLPSPATAPTGPRAWTPGSATGPARAADTTAVGGTGMKQGDALNGYTVTTKPTNAGGGKCVWAFATRGGQEYFIKEFLEPKWPLDSSPGPPSSKEIRRADCLAFEQRHRHVMSRLKSDDIGGGNIVTAEAFFREATTYYKVTNRIDASNLASLGALSTHQKAVVLRTLALSLQQLHRIDIVHGPEARQRAGPEKTRQQPVYGQAHRLR